MVARCAARRDSVPGAFSPQGGPFPNVFRRVLTALAALAVSAGAHAYDPTQGDFTRREPLDIRVVSWNTERNWGSAASTDAPFRRVMAALDPDVVVLQEIELDRTDEQILANIEAAIPLPEGQSWQLARGLAGGIRNVILSRHGLTATRTDTIPSSSTRGVTMGLVQLPDPRYPLDLYIMGVHLKCCNSEGTEDADRQRSADAIAKWLGDARQEGGSITLPEGTPMIVTGDFNLVGGPQPEATIRTGNIINEATFGADVKGDWDETDMTDVTPRNPFNNTTNTWPSDDTTPTSRLDRFYIQDSATEVATTFILNTRSLNATQLANAGLQANDTSPSVTDHLPIVLDIRYRGRTGTVTYSTPEATCGQTVTVTVTDADLAAVAAPITVAWSATNGGSGTFTLAAQGGGVFSTSLDLGGIDLGLGDGDELTVTYTDLLDADGRESEREGTLPVACSSEGNKWVVY